MPMPAIDVVIAAFGARTAIGATAPATAAAARAGVMGFHEHPTMIDSAGNKMIVAMVPDIDGDRLTPLALASAKEALAEIREPVRTIVGLPPSRPGRPALESSLAERLREECPISEVEFVPTGHAAGMMAIQRGWTLIREGAAEVCLAGGVDSYLAPETLEWLETNDQLHSAGPRNNAWGFVPGEAAAWCLLASRPLAEQMHWPTDCRIVLAAATRETKPIKTDAVCTGEGLTALFRQLFEALPKDKKVDQVFCDMNGEPYRAEEYGFATMRTGAAFVDPTDLTAPADCWGDVGAATGPLLALRIAAAARKGFAKGDWSLAWTSSESGERSGMIVHAPRMKRRT